MFSQQFPVFFFFIYYYYYYYYYCNEQNRKTPSSTYPSHIQNPKIPLSTNPSHNNPQIVTSQINQNPQQLRAQSRPPRVNCDHNGELTATTTHNHRKPKCNHREPIMNTTMPNNQDTSKCESLTIHHRHTKPEQTASLTHCSPQWPNTEVNERPTICWDREREKEG